MQEVTGGQLFASVRGFRRTRVRTAIFVDMPKRPPTIEPTRGHGRYLGCHAGCVLYADSQKTCFRKEAALAIGIICSSQGQNSSLHNWVVGPRLLVLGLALSLAAGIGWGQPAHGTIPLRDSLGPTWNDVCSLAVGNTDVRWAVGDSGKVLKTVGDVIRLEYILGRGQFNLQSVSFADADHGWIVGHKRDDPERMRGVVFRTTTGGGGPQAWTAAFPAIRPGVKVPFLKVQTVSAMRVWVKCGDGYQLRSCDGGLNWLVAAKRAGADTGGRSGQQEHHDEE